MPYYPCLTCGALYTEAYCPTHKPQRKKPFTHRLLYNAEYRRAAKKIREQATACWICGKPPTLSDPIQADHLYPGNPNSPLLPAHRSCNIRRQTRNRKNPRDGETPT